MPAPIILPASTAGTGVTRARYVSALADQLGVYRATTVATTATGADPKRLVLSDDLRDDGEDPDDTFERLYVYVADGDEAGQQRRIVRTGHVGRFGAAYLSRPFTTTLTSGTPLLITGPLPVGRNGRRKGLQTIVNEALARIVLEARLPFTGTGSREISLDDYPWLNRTDQTSGLYDTHSSGVSTDPLDLSPGRYRIVANGADRSLVTDDTYYDGEAFELAVIVAAVNLISDGTTWAYVDGTGLTDDDDQAAAPLNWVVTFGMVLALRHLMTLVDMDPSLADAERVRMLAGYQRRLPTWAAAAAYIHERLFPVPAQELAGGLATRFTVAQIAAPWGSSWPS